MLIYNVRKSPKSTVNLGWGGKGLRVKPVLGFRDLAASPSRPRRP